MQKCAKSTKSHTNIDKKLQMKQIYHISNGHSSLFNVNRFKNCLFSVHFLTLFIYKCVWFLYFSVFRHKKKITKSWYMRIMFNFAR